MKRSFPDILLCIECQLLNKLKDYNINGSGS